MEQTTASAPQDADVALLRLDQIIALVTELQDNQCDLLREHLQSARTSLLGGMPTEYEFSLRAAKETAGQLSDAGIRKTATENIDSLLRETPVSETKSGVHPPPPPPENKPTKLGETGSRLHRFLHGSETTLGVFYPTDYIFAAFPTLEYAQGAASALHKVGFTELMVASAEETSQFFAELQVETGIWGTVMSSLSRFFGTEEVFADIDASEAHKGAGFLAVYCPKEDQAERIRDIAAPFHPLAMQLYLRSGIQSLVAGQFPGPQGHHEEQP